MKKLLTMIGVLIIIFIGIFIYKNNKNQNIVNVSEVNQIEEYISKIYMWKEITNEALPKFDNINNAPDLWIWEVVKKNLEEYELTYEQIQEKAREIFGSTFTKKFPQEGSEFINYNEETGKYLSTGMGLDTMEDSFFIKNIIKVKGGYEVEIVEYLEDYEQSRGPDGENENYDIYIRNLDEEIVSTIKSNESETRAIEVVKENIEQFSTKKIKLKKESEKLYIESVE